ncbi:sn-glycerol-3-phosphate ABC transporter ATP-binding protein UgpC [Pasteurella skyensis]|uniref:Sn-glycerol-3-phosphate ABC transporter ATP-binding protein UgpC n=1 Tax=Phocoenobacter skyensis TaxID=97481 RepID=A0AAJ6NZX6_9PAST|nr:sn-glycerol-3-phosphate ABC transporter ATP-binding protein UgpC [Pasteurella skyensis]MDP8172069.1 sn-glycerol-3-phosphate ABC transporter ATP-binding protein UgpC [Pasteurella skyensis]MDP8178471.1 sn-glycerol-3-phosphate ABC transporter ATP-binding protein UgpC [Pasteurella skyensis]MDP8182773.1 sn-glycerol-3-phosphate ABC transporter ATP-binding protein UgpC [Pasteurella skyensis]MDP8188631.1 sn-glycerol-3-phosphate ABC transporter ATP-binding protein UgpC [Pasteurella skyensis]
MAHVELKNVTKSFGNVQVIYGVDLNIKEGEFCVFVGPSGCGKSTLLRMISGLESVTEGTIRIGERDVTKMDPAERGVAMVFQTYALYPHMTVEENMSFGLRMNKIPQEAIKNKVDEVANILQLDKYMKRRPKALSGGQRQRVAIGRALVRDPDVFLFDEPLSNLDAELRVEMRSEIARLHQEIGATMIYVTHDQVEAMTLADKIVVLRAGSIEQVGAPMDLYNDPDNKFVAGFIGSPAMNFVTGLVKNGQLHCDVLVSPVNQLPDSVVDGEVIVGMRPENMTIVDGDALTVDFVEYLGGSTYVHSVTKNGERMNIEMTGQQTLKRGDKIAIEMDEKDLRFFDKKTEKRLR